MVKVTLSVIWATIKGLVFATYQAIVEIVSSLFAHIAAFVTGVVVKGGLIFSGKMALSEAFAHMLGMFLLRDLTAFTAWLCKGSAELGFQIAARHVLHQQPLLEASTRTATALSGKLEEQYTVAIGTLYLSLAAFVLFFALPQAMRALTRPRLRVFISFQHSFERQAAEVQASLSAAGIRAYRLPHQEGHGHQEILSEVTRNIERSHAFVCIPGAQSSFVEHEVMAATVLKMPVVFLLPDAEATLPNTADKRYPVFDLEQLRNQGYRPLASLLSYVGADLRSTRYICVDCLLSGVVARWTRGSVAIIGACLALLWTYMFLAIKASAAGIEGVDALPEAASVALVWCNLVVLGTCGSLAIIATLFCYSFIRRQLKQLAARRRARLKSVSAQFNRQDWRDLAVGGAAAGAIYACLMESAPIAHHERPAG